MLITAGLIHVLPLSERRGICRKEAADIWGVSPTTFDKLVRDGIAPAPHITYGRRIWHRHKLEAAFDMEFGYSSPGRRASSEHFIRDDGELDRELAAFEAKHGQR